MAGLVGDAMKDAYVGEARQQFDTCFFSLLVGLPFVLRR